MGIDHISATNNDAVKCLPSRWNDRIPAKSDKKPRT